MTMTTEVLTTTIGHHAELEASLNTLVDGVVVAARPGASPEGPVRELPALRPVMQERFAAYRAGTS